MRWIQGVYAKCLAAPYQRLNRAPSCGIHSPTVFRFSVSVLAPLSTSRDDKGCQLLVGLCSGDTPVPNNKCRDAGDSQFTRPLPIGID